MNRRMMWMAGLSLVLVGCGDGREVQQRGVIVDPGPVKADGSNSCNGACGGVAPSGCWCDELCTLYGDCCADQQSQCGSLPPKICGPILDGACPAGQVCDIKSCAIGATGSCVEQPEADQCFELTGLHGEPVCGCDGKTYVSNCARLAAGAALARAGACQGPAKLCGTIAGLTCPAGEKCLLDGDYPDAGGKCVPQDFCATAKDCAGLFSPIFCMGDWTCQDQKCVFECGSTPPPPPAKICGPIPGGTCGAGEVCNVESCGIGATGTCVKQPVPGSCMLMHLLYDPQCGCDGKTYGNDCERLAAGAALDHAGPCQAKKCGTIAGLTCPAGEKCLFDGPYPDAGGHCVPLEFCQVDEDCEGLFSPLLCIGSWHCQKQQCTFVCGN